MSAFPAPQPRFDGLNSLIPMLASLGILKPHQQFMLESLQRILNPPTMDGPLRSGPIMTKPEDFMLPIMNKIAGMFTGQGSGTNPVFKNSPFDSSFLGNILGAGNIFGAGGPPKNTPVPTL
jgi:hypothetical protein